jgi:hypothetical protein
VELWGGICVHCHGCVLRLPQIVSIRGGEGYKTLCGAQATISCRLAKCRSGISAGRVRPAASAIEFFGRSASAGCSGQGG